MSMSRVVSSFASILGEAQAIQTSTLHTFSLFLKSFGTLTAQDEPLTDLDIPRPHPYLTTHIRQEEIASLLEELANPKRSCIACTGGHGMGKSTLALLAIRSLFVRTAFDRRRWINCHALTDPSHFLHVLAAQMGVPAADFSPSAYKTRLEAIVAAIQRLYPAGRTLIVLDDLDHLYFLDKSFADAAIEALAKIEGLTLLLTVNGWTPAPPPVVEWTLQLKALTQEKAEYLFHSIYPVPFQRKELSELLKLVGAMPQYIVILAHLAYERRLQPADLLEIIDDPETNLFGIEMEGHKSLEASMQAYTPEDRLGRDPHALRVFYVLASLPGGLPRDRLSSYLGLPPETVDSICDQMANLSFIQTEHTGHLMLTKPVRDYALRFSEFDEQTRQLLLSELISLAEIPKSRLRPGTPEFSKTVRQFENDKTNLENILFTFLDQHLPVAVEAALRYLAPRCAVRPSLKLATKAVEVAQIISDQRLIAHTLQTLGEANYNIGLFDAEVVLGRAEVLFNSCGDEDSVIHGLECRFLMSDIWVRRGIHVDDDEYPPGLDTAVQRSSTLTSEAGKRCHAHGLLRQASVLSSMMRRCNGPSDIQNLVQRHGAVGKLLQTAVAIFQDIEDDYELALCALRFGRIHLVSVAAMFQEWGDLEASARCYHAVVSSDIEYIKVNNSRKTYLEREGGSANSEVLEFLRKAMDIYELLGRDLDVAFCQYHLAQLLPPVEAIPLYSRAIHIFKASNFTHHRDRATLDMCYSLMEEEHYSEAIMHLEVLQEIIGYCGQIFVLRARELLAECHCRLDATRPALQAVRDVLDALQQSDSRPDEVELLTSSYRNLLATLDGPSNISPAIAFEKHVQGGDRLIELKDEQSQPE